MQVKFFDFGSELWEDVADCADNYTWSTGKNLAKKCVNINFLIGKECLWH